MITNRSVKMPIAQHKRQNRNAHWNIFQGLLNLSCQHSAHAPQAINSKLLISASVKSVRSVQLEHDRK